MDKLSTKLFYLLAFLLLAVLLFFLPKGTQERIRGAGMFFMEPGATLARITARISREALGGLPENMSVEERDELLQKLAEATRKATLSSTEQEKLKRDNQFLQGLLRIVNTPREYTLTVCQVIQRDPFGDYYGTLRIDRGLNDGLRPGQAVLTEQGLAGILGEVRAKDASVILVGSPQFSIACKIAGKDIAGLIHVPAREKGCTLLLPPQTLDLDSLTGPMFDLAEIGDLVVTNSIGNENLLEDIPIGKIVHIETSSAGAYLYQLTPQANLNNLRFLLVAIPPKPGA